MEKNSIKQVLKDPRFTTMVRKKWRLSFGLSIGMTSIYATFVLAMVFKPGLLLRPLTSANPFNIGLLLTLVMLVFIMGSMFCYLLFRGNDAHDDIHKLIAEHDEVQTENSD